MGKIAPLFARQPIFDNKLDVVAYEFLFRSGLENHAVFIDGDQASSHVMLYSFGQHKIEELIGDAKAFINFTKQFLVYPPPLPPEKLVVEVLEDVEADEHVLEGLQRLRNKGYEIALDDFFINKDTKALLNHASIVKIDVLSQNEETLLKYLKYLRPLKLTLLAEKIETKEMFDHCVELGFDLFQGYFLSKPNIVEGIKLEESKQSILRLLVTLSNSDIEIPLIVNAISSDPRLSYRILRIVNSTAYQFSNKIQSLGQAVTMLGITQIRNWASFLILASDGSKPAELSVMGMTRAKFCEQIGARLNNPRFGESCFTMGLLSTFDAFLDIPLDELLPHLGLADDINDALLHHEGLLGRILEYVLEFEHANWDYLKELKQGELAIIKDKEINNFYSESLVWANNIASQFN